MVNGSLVKYTVTFNLNGGEAVEGYVQSLAVPAGSCISLTVPERTGYTFAGWYTGDGINDGLFTTTTSIRQDYDLVARWTINEFTVTFYDYYGKPLKIETVNYGSAATAPEAPTIDKLRFTDWDVDFSCVTEDLSVRAQYVTDLFTLSYDTDGGTKIEDNVYYVGDTPKAPTPPTKSGYVFLGWYTDSTRKEAYDFTKPLFKDTTLYAKFSESIPISSADELKKIATNPNAKYHLTCNIDLDGSAWAPIWGFGGVLNGEGYSISNFTISSSDYEAGFFAQNSGLIQNVTFRDFVMTVNCIQEFSAGAVVGNNSGTVENVHVEDAVLSFSYVANVGTSGTLSNYAGGLVGKNNGNIINSSAAVEMFGNIDFSLSISNTNNYYYAQGHLKIGGIAGINNLSIDQCSATVSLEGQAISRGSGTSGNTWYGYAYPTACIIVGGAVSENRGTITNSSADLTSSVSGSYSMSGRGSARVQAHTGGFAQENHGTIEMCKATGNIETANAGFTDVYMGGFVNYNFSGIIKNSYTEVNMNDIGAVTAAGIGGFANGNENGATITACYASGDIETYASAANVGGFVATNKTGASITKSFATGNITMWNMPTNIGHFVGYSQEGSTMFKCYYSSDRVVTMYGAVYTPNADGSTDASLAKLQLGDITVDVMSWNTDVWNITGIELPTLKSLSK